MRSAGNPGRGSLPCPAVTRARLLPLLMLGGLCVLGTALWMQHLRAWDLGGRSPVLGYDSAQYALAARELADHGRLATSFALPIELARHAAPPWPLAVVQPGMVISEAALFALARLVPGASGGAHGDPREWLVLVIPFLCYLGAALAIAVTAARLLERHAPDLSAAGRWSAGAIAGAALLLDPEAQHFAAGGFTELPFALGLIVALAALALEWAPARPLLFGLLLGAAGSFRANMLWLAPLFALGAMALAPAGRRARVLAGTLAGFVLVSAPWWLYKWSAFGSPGWDLTRWVVWDHVEGRSWFSIYHLPDPPELPAGMAAARLLAAKTARNLPNLLLAVGTGPRPLWLGALALWAAVAPGPRGARIAAWLTLAAFAAGVLAAAVSIPWLRYVFPARVALEAAGLVALWALLARFAGSTRTAGVRAGALAVGLLALGWGAWQTQRGLEEARETAARREVPSAEAIATLGERVQQEVPPGETVMSNLGPILAWTARRPVVHLALAPTDLDACRHRLDTRTVVLVYRDPERAGPAWAEVVTRPEEAIRHPEWNVVRANSWTVDDGFRVVWLELGPLRPQVAAVARE